MLARRQPPDQLADLHEPQADDTLRPPRRTPRLAGAALPLVRKRRKKRRHGCWTRVVQLQATAAVAPPTNETQTGDGRGTPQSSAAPARAQVAEREGDGEGGDRRGPYEAGEEVEDDEGEEDGEGQEHHQAVVPVVVRRSCRGSVVVRQPMEVHRRQIV